ncbi:MAG: FeoA family protein [Planctomycetota bacterium]|nr:FeoA family protein [Planctomycetota bacterium]MDA1105795.1 FeoA family protein [Planctomycetota bacterium]
MPAVKAPEPIRIPLSQLKPGQRARVDCTTLDDLPSGDRCLLAAMGLGDQCELKRCSGHACIIAVDRTKIAIGPWLADRVFVEPIDDPTTRP